MNLSFTSLLSSVRAALKRESIYIRTGIRISAHWYRMLMSLFGGLFLVACAAVYVYVAIVHGQFFSAIAYTPRTSVGINETKLHTLVADMDARAAFSHTLIQNPQVDPSRGGQ